MHQRRSHLSLISNPLQINLRLQTVHSLCLPRVSSLLMLVSRLHEAGLTLVPSAWPLIGVGALVVFHVVPAFESLVAHLAVIRSFSSMLLCMCLQNLARWYHIGTSFDGSSSYSYPHPVQLKPSPDCKWVCLCLLKDEL